MNPSQKDQIGRALGRIPSGVAVLSARQGSQNFAMLASWFQQVGFEPPMICVAIKQDRPVAQALQNSEKFALNLLHTGQKDMMAHFGKGFEPGQDPFQGLETETQQLGLPLLKHSLCFLECQLKHVYEAGDHSLFVGEVLNAGTEEEGQPVVHLRRNGFHY